MILRCFDRRQILAGAAAGAAAALSQPRAALAQSFPTKAITIVVPFAAGGPSDAMARLIGQGLGEITGRQVVVENVPGAGGVTGSARVAKGEADGHTILFGNIGTHAANAGLYRRLPYDPRTDFEPISLVASVPFIVSVKTASAAQDFAGFRRLVTEQGDKLVYGSAGLGSASHLASLMLMAAMGGKATHVPYRGAGPALNDLIAGQLDFMSDQTVTMLPQAQSGSVRAIAVLSRQRLAQLPDTPTAIESGLAGFEVEAWNALFAPKGTPQPVVDRLAELVRQALAADGLRQRLAASGATLPSAAAIGSAPLKAHVASEVERWTTAIRAAGVSVE
jgi:tripartite-type tricarboxylate transporter receptor subunit TctC